MRWIVDHILWDEAGSQRTGLERVFWATRKVWIALVLSALLDWMGWARHHPPAIWFVVLFHFVIALAIVAIVVFLWRRLRSA